VGRARDERLDQLHQEELSRAGALALLVLCLAACNGGTVDAHALKRDSEKIASTATEGQLLAKDVAKGASTKNFARVHAKELSQFASNMADALATRPVSHGIEQKVHKLSRLAARVAARLGQLQLHPTDRSLAKSLEQSLSDDADAANKLGK
jgi:hypothetical protein